MENVKLNEINNGIISLGVKKINDEVNVRKEVDYCDFLAYLQAREDWEEDMAIIALEEWHNFYDKSYEWEDDRDIEMEYVNVENFYSKGFGMTLQEFEKAFICTEELEGYEDDQYIIVVKLNINGKEKGFVIDGGM